MAAEATSKHDSVSVCILSNNTAMCNYINVEYNILQVGSGRDGASVLYFKKKTFQNARKCCTLTLCYLQLKVLFSIL